MEIVKKNLLSIICGVVAIAAILAIPTFIRTQQKALQTRLNDRAATYNALDALKKKTRHQPVVTVDPNATVPDLPGYPGPQVIESGKKAISAVTAQSLELEKLANDRNKHELLVPNSLPNISDTFTFQRAYKQELEKGIPESLNSVTPPTEAEINAQKEALRQDRLAKAARNQATNEILYKEAVDAEIARATAELPEKMKNDAAFNHKLYMAPGTALSADPDISGGNTGMSQLPAEKIWLAQLGLWVQQDVAKAVAEANQNSKSVANSPVKELVLIEVSSGRDIYATPGSGATAAPTPMGVAPTSNVKANSPTDPLPMDFAVSPTGRVCNGVFDVVHFTVCMNVQAADVNKVIDQLQKGRLITVYHSDIEAVNGAEKQEQGYFYGPVPVVTLTLKCEELFMRSWTRPLMPQSIKQYLNVQEPAPGQSTAMAN